MDAGVHARGGSRAVRRQALRFAGMSLAINSLMAVFKIAIGIFSGSHALLASALYSINDVLSAIAVAVSLRVGYRRPTKSYAYGYGKAEFIAVGMVSLAIAIGVFFMFVYSVVDILMGVAGAPHVAAVGMAGVGAAVSWWLGHRGQKYADELQSPALSTSAQHHHADAVGSFAAIVGIGGAMLGLHALDRVVAILEALHLVALSGTLLARSTKGLMDAAIPAEDAELVESACGKVGGVRRVVHVRSRRIGCETWVDVAVAVAGKTSTGQASEICQRVREAVHGVLGHTVVTQVRFQGPQLVIEGPGPGGSAHG